MHNELLLFFQTHPDWLLWLGVISTLTIIISLAAAPWYVARLPADFFLAGTHITGSADVTMAAQEHQSTPIAGTSTAPADSKSAYRGRWAPDTCQFAADMPLLQVLLPPALRRLARNTLALVFVMLGLLLFVTPGPGLVVLLAGFALCDLPVKYRLLRWLATHTPLLESMNQYRERRGLAPFLAPGSESRG